MSESFLFESVESSSFLAIWAPSGFEWIIVLVVALLLFGKRLPDVARSLGKGIVEFKKGVKGIEEDVEQAEYNSQNSNSSQGSSQGAPPTNNPSPHSSGSNSPQGEPKRDPE